MQHSSKVSSVGLVAAFVAVSGGVLASVGSLIAWASGAGPLPFPQGHRLIGWVDHSRCRGGAGPVWVGAPGWPQTRSSSRDRGPRDSGWPSCRGLAAYDAARAGDSVSDAFAEIVAPQVAQQVGIGIDATRQFIRDAIDSGQIPLHISLSLGVFLVIGGGAVGVVGGALGLRSSNELSPEMPSMPEMPGTSSTDVEAAPPAREATEQSTLGAAQDPGSSSVP